jgi:hypothetical protein
MGEGGLHSFRNERRCYRRLVWELEESILDRNCAASTSLRNERRCCRLVCESEESVLRPRQELRSENLTEPSQERSRIPVFVRYEELIWFFGRTKRFFWHTITTSSNFISRDRDRYKINSTETSINFLVDIHVTMMENIVTVHVYFCTPVK